MSVRNLFVAVATGQNVANLPPILQFAERGDTVIWLESELAQRNAWSAGAAEVLRGRGIDSLREPVPGEINDPATVEKAMRKAIEPFRGRAGRLRVVLNGGQKLTPFGLALAARVWRDQWDGEVDFLYSDDRPAQVQLRERRIGGSMRTVPYDAERMLSLEEVLRTAGHRLEADAPRLDWKKPPPPEPYGTDREFTALVHAYARGDESEEFRANWPGFEHWSKGSKKIFNQRMTPILDSLVDGQVSKRAKFDAYPRMVSLVREFVPRMPAPRPSRADQERLRGEGWWTEQGGSSIGPRFERAVAARLQRFLADNPNLASVVREARLNARVPGAEWDVVLVLVNGILLHLECKSWRARKKDMDARMLVIQRASSRLARTCLVTPMFPEFAGEPWFKEMHRNYRDMLGFGVPVLAFTMRGSSPRREYSLPGIRGTFPWPEPFEDSLRRQLAPYAP